MLAVNRPAKELSPRSTRLAGTNNAATALVSSSRSPVGHRSRGTVQLQDCPRTNWTARMRPRDRLTLQEDRHGNVRPCKLHRTTAPRLDRVLLPLEAVDSCSVSDPLRAESIGDHRAQTVRLWMPFPRSRPGALNPQGLEPAQPKCHSGIRQNQSGHSLG